MDLEMVCVCVCVSLPIRVCVWVFGAWVCEWERAREKDREVFAFVCMRLWEFLMHFLSQTLLGSTHWPAQLFLHQFMMQFLFKVMKYTWLLPPDRTDAKNTWGTARTQRTCVLLTSFNSAAINYLTVYTLSVCMSNLVISLTKELQPLSSLVHEDTIQVASLHRTDLYGLFSPSHNLIWADMSCKEKCNISTWSLIHFLQMMHPLSFTSM